MCPQRYYATSNLYPYVIEAVLTRIKLYFCNMLYPAEDYVTQSSKRFIMADTSNDNLAIKESIKKFYNSQGEFPFTAYSINDDEPLEYKSHYSVSGNFYSSLLNSYVTYVPMKLNINLTTYYTTPYDFWRAMTWFAVDEASITRLDVPVIINDVSTYFTIDLDYTTERGQLAFDIEQAFNVGKIYPVIHNVAVRCAYITLASNNTTDKFSGNVVYPVDDILFYLRTLQDARHLEQNPIVDLKYSPDNPEVATSVPANNATNILRNSTIVITFNVGMNETTVLNNIDIVPYIEYDAVFDNYSKILTITPRDLFTASTEYNLLINDNAKSGDDLYLEVDYSLIFITGLS